MHLFYFELLLLPKADLLVYPIWLHCTSIHEPIAAFPLVPTQRGSTWLATVLLCFHYNWVPPHFGWSHCGQESLDIICIWFKHNNGWAKLTVANDSSLSSSCIQCFNGCRLSLLSIMYAVSLQTVWALIEPPLSCCRVLKTMRLILAKKLFLWLS